jgi:hypothetical protein
MTEEQVNELARTHGLISDGLQHTEDVSLLLAEVRRLREALRFYANDQHWHTTIVVADGTYRGRELPAPGSKEEMYPGGEVIRVTAIDQDGGKRARQALEGSE